MMVRFVPVIVVLLMTLLFGWLLTAPDETMETHSPMRPVPAIALPLLGETETATLPANQWYLVNFFASWCIPCVVEHPQLLYLKDKVTLIGIAYKDKAVLAKTFLQQHKNPYQYVMQDDQGVAAIEFGISGVPESFLVNAEGKIVWSYAGPLLDSQLHDLMKVLDAR